VDSGLLVGVSAQPRIRSPLWASSQPPQQPVRTSPIAPPWASNAVARVQFVNGGVDGGID
jgi:hypothetical protein